MAQQIRPAPALDEFDLDVTTVERTDVASLQVLTDDNCGSTCGACTTGVH